MKWPSTQSEAHPASRATSDQREASRTARQASRSQARRRRRASRTRLRRPQTLFTATCSDLTSSIFISATATSIPGSSGCSTTTSPSKSRSSRAIAQDAANQRSSSFSWTLPTQMSSTWLNRTSQAFPELKARGERTTAACLDLTTRTSTTTLKKM